MSNLARNQSIAAVVFASAVYGLPWTIYIAVNDLLWTSVVFSVFFLTAFVPLVAYVLGGYVSPLVLLVAYSLVLLYDVSQHGRPEASTGFLLFFPLYLASVAVFTGIEIGSREDVFDRTRTRSIAVAVLASVAYALPWTVYMLKDDPLGMSVDFSIFFLAALVPLVAYVLGKYVSPLLLLGASTLVLLNGSYRSGTPESSVGFLLFLPLYLVLVVVLVGIEFGVRSYAGRG